MAKFVAIDAGGTKTQCWVADETRVLASATGGTVKLMSVGEEVGLEGFILFRGTFLLAEAEAEEGDARKVDGDQGEVEGAEPLRDGGEGKGGKRLGQRDS